MCTDTHSIHMIKRGTKYPFHNRQFSIPFLQYPLYTNVEYLCGNAWMGYWATSWRTAHGFEFVNALKLNWLLGSRQYLRAFSAFILFVQQQLNVKHGCKSEDVIPCVTSICCKAIKTVIGYEIKYCCFLNIVCSFTPLKEFGSTSIPPSTDSNFYPRVLQCWSSRTVLSRVSSSWCPLAFVMSLLHLVVVAIMVIQIIFHSIHVSFLSRDLIYLLLLLLHLS